MGEFYGLIFTPLFLSPLLSFFFSYPSNIEIIFNFSDIITKFTPHFKKPWIRPCKGAVMIVHVLSGGLASSYPIRRAFLQHISWTVFVEPVINKRKSSCHFGMAVLLYGCLFILPNTAVILDFLINQKLFLSTSEYHHYYQGRKWNMPEFLKSP